MNTFGRCSSLLLVGLLLPACSSGAAQDTSSSAVSPGQGGSGGAGGGQGGTGGVGEPAGGNAGKGAAGGSSPFPVGQGGSSAQGHGGSAGQAHAGSGVGGEGGMSAGGTSGSAGAGGDVTMDVCQSAAADGFHCGSGTDASTLFKCVGQHTVGATPCMTSCHSSSSGSDYCDTPPMPADPCSGAASGDGPYCGASLIPAGDASTLYTCQGRMTLGSKHCDSGCQPAAGGTPDACQGGGADPCKGAVSGNGAYCGANLAGGDKGTLYNCQNQTTAGSMACASGCHVSPPGQADYCEQSTGGDPCESAMNGNGAYCGAALKGGDGGKLYDCQNQKTNGTMPCASGCQVAAPGHPDSCGPASGGDPCQNEFSSDGAYCGSSIKGDANTLYQCAGKKTSSSMACPNGCHTAPPGQPDSCNASSGGDPCTHQNGGNGAYCGPSLGAGDPGTLYQCANNATLSSMACPNGCHQAPPGMPDTCNGGTSGGDPCAAAGNGNGAYCGGTLPGGDPGKLYDCQGTKTAGTTVCANGCQPAPPGSPDGCKPAVGPGGGKVSCNAPQWWDVGITYGPYKDYNPGNGVTYWWDTDLAIGASSPVQLRHDSKLIDEGTHNWGWQPTFIDQVTGKKFQFLHLRPQHKYTTAKGTVYPAGTIVGVSGGDTSDTGYPTFSSGPHLCVQTADSWGSSFPHGQEACQ